MSKLKIITDSNSGILQSEAKELGIYVVPMPFTINNEEYLEEISISQNKFYDFLAQNANVTTSQPSEYYLEELWNNLLKDNDELLYIPMSSGLSATCSNAVGYAEAFAGKVHVVDNKRISATQKESVFEAIELAKQGKSATEIKKYLESTGNIQSIYITVPELKYLKRGGRISHAVATLGSLLNVKPILFSNGGSFDKYAMVLSMAQAKKRMIQAIKKDLETKFKKEYEAGNMYISIAHTQNEVEAKKFKELIAKELPNVKIHFVDPLSLSISCHIGPRALGIAISINNCNKE